MPATRSRTIKRLKESVAAGPTTAPVKRLRLVDRKARPKRLEGIDLARGFAIGLMILSHGVKGLLGFDQIPSWGLVPIHLITKFSSSLFILVFGVSLAISFVPAVGTTKWREKRKDLWLRGLVVLFWYKLLTIVEMFHLQGRSEILNALMYKTFPVYVEILGFYALSLLWMPLVLPAWKKSAFMVKALIPVALIYANSWLATHFDFFGLAPLRAILVEHDDFYTWGQLARAPFIFFGLLLGQMILEPPRFLRSLRVSHLLFIMSAALFGAYLVQAWPDLQGSLHSIALNKGKHPPELGFMLFSIGGALGLLGLALHGGNDLARKLFPITEVGKNSLSAFTFHAFILFVFYRYLFDLWLKVSYPQALGLSLLLFVMTWGWIRAKAWVQRA